MIRTAPADICRGLPVVLVVLTLACALVGILAAYTRWLGRELAVYAKKIDGASRGNERLCSLLREISAQRWECAAEDGLCPDCGAASSEPHDSECLLGQIDAELGE